MKGGYTKTERLTRRIAVIPGARFCTPAVVIADYSISSDSPN
jgi:hypothetical protein